VISGHAVQQMKERNAVRVQRLEQKLEAKEQRIARYRRKLARERQVMPIAFHRREPLKHEAATDAQKLVDELAATRADLSNQLRDISAQLGSLTAASDARKEAGRIKAERIASLCRDLKWT
jgi:uncharacterized protein (DUF342 family)